MLLLRVLSLIIMKSSPNKIKNVFKRKLLNVELQK